MLYIIPRLLKGEFCFLSWHLGLVFLGGLVWFHLSVLSSIGQRFLLVFFFIALQYLVQEAFHKQ